MLLRLIALLEGFSTLAIQMIALRQAIPVVGSSVVLTSVYIGIILLALSAGYRVGGIVAEKYKYSRRHLGTILACYLIIAGVWYSLITFGMHTQLLESILASTQGYILTLFLVSMILFVVPVFLASQTLPLLTELIPIASKGHAAGQMLFASTVGSFLGSVLTATVLFPLLGVAMTGAITVSMVLLAGVLCIFIRNKKRGRRSLIIWSVFCIGLLYGANAVEDVDLLWQGDSAYHSMEIREYRYQNQQVRLMVTNGGFSSARNPQELQSPFPYVRSLVEETIALQPTTILLIGTAGFTYPAELDEYSRLERIDAIDIDGAFLDVAQDHLLQDQLTEKVQFYPQSARYFIKKAIQERKKYDLIVLDAYNGRFVPAELATTDFFEDLKVLCAENCEILSNLIIDYPLESEFARSVVGAMQQVFGTVWIQRLNSRGVRLGNSIISTYPSLSNSEEVPALQKKSLPSDDRNDLERELVEMRNT